MTKISRVATVAIIFATLLFPTSVYADGTPDLINGTSLATASHLAFVQTQAAVPTSSPAAAIDPIFAAGPAPAVHAEDYQTFVGPGTSTLIVRTVFALADGSTTTCQVRPREVARLYPRTDYTVWLVEHWILQLQQNRRQDLSTAYPGVFVRTLPRYLTPGTPGEVMRAAYCNADHEFEFDNVPVGKFVLYAIHENFAYSSREKYETQSVMTPEGLQNETVPGQTEDTSHSTEGYINYSPRAVNIEMPGRYLIDSNLLNRCPLFDRALIRRSYVAREIVASVAPYSRKRYVASSMMP